ncbi:hypothetical protein [Burkholderia vietnamiensis]|uniref:hypothetical protein n=1 Tax=Burkholderia vietnamiensis TaxID=60552 RepID=UPI00158CD4F0|nr:hypothetical protein [Burkholderia vietnamiensis]
MFWLNKKDGDALLDDVVRMGQHMRQRALAESATYVPSKEARQLIDAIEAERSRNIKLAVARNKELDAVEAAQRQVRHLYTRQWDLSVQIEAAWPVLEDAIQETARTARKQLTGVQEYVHAFMRKVYDHEIDRRLALGLLMRDPRKQGDLWRAPSRIWYSSLSSGSESSPINQVDKATLSAAGLAMANAEATLKVIKGQPEPEAMEAKQPLWLKKAQAESAWIQTQITHSKLVLEDTQLKRSAACYFNHHLAACVTTVMMTLDDVLEHLAESTGQASEVVQLRPYTAIRQAYDARIDAALASKKLVVDPRGQLELWAGPHRDWYPANELAKRAAK